jgi:acyl-CoA thioester hydrolase
VSNPLPDFPVTVELPIAWGDMDAFGHVNNTVFFRYFESARIAYFDEVGYGALMAERGLGPILAETSCRFRRPLTYPDRVVVGARVPQVGEDRFTMEYRIWSEGQATVAGKGEGLIVSYDYRAQMRVPLPTAIAAAIEALEGRAP